MSLKFHKPMHKLLVAVTAMATAMASPQAHAQRVPGQIFDTEMEALLADYARPVLEAAGQGSGRIRVRVINNPTFNAFVIDGRNIYMHTGVILSSTTPNQVIGVLAHETGHITAAHISDLRNQITSLQNRSLLLQLLGIGLMVAGAVAGGGGCKRRNRRRSGRSRRRLRNTLAGILTRTPRSGGLRRPGWAEIIAPNRSVRQRHARNLRTHGQRKPVLSGRQLPPNPSFRAHTHHASAKARATITILRQS